MLAVLGLILAPVIPIGLACFTLCIPLFYVRNPAYPDDAQWSVYVAEALVFALVPTAILIARWLEMIRSGRSARLWGWAMGLAWGFPLLPMLALGSIYQMAQLHVQGLADPRFVGLVFVCIAIGATQAWIGWKVVRLGAVSIESKVQVGR